MILESDETDSTGVFDELDPDVDVAGIHLFSSDRKANRPRDSTRQFLVISSRFSSIASAPSPTGEGSKESISPSKDKLYLCVTERGDGQQVKLITLAGVGLVREAMTQPEKKSVFSRCKNN